MTHPGRTSLDVLASPETALDAEAWIDTVVRWVGANFHPDRSFRSYALDLSSSELEALEGALGATRGLLGDRTYDIAYRCANAYLAARDPGWEPHYGPLPATQPPARWWLIERADRPDVATSEAETKVVYEDDYGTWWEYDPRTGHLHDTPSLYIDYYYRTGYGEQPRFTRLTPLEARRRIASGLPRSTDGSPPPICAEDSLDPEAILPSSSEG